MGIRYKNREKLEKHIKERNPGTIGNVWTRRIIHPDNATYGRLPQEWRERLISDIKDNGVYVVYSYQTPIAWTKLDGKGVWTIPDESYSVTTTHHQNIVKVATST